MPYLPSEGDPTKALINGEMRDVLAFRYLPILWYKYPIPNEIRQYWYTERPDILKYMQKAYKNVDIQFLPDEIIDQIKSNSIKEIVPQISQVIEVSNDFSSPILIADSTINSLSDFTSYFINLTQNILTF